MVMRPFAAAASVLFVLVSVLVAPVIGTTSHSASGPHIADVNILLPPKMTNPVEYRLQGTDGCFKWSWDHHDILSVLPEYNMSSHCSTSARLISIAPYAGRKETAVYAADVHTGIVIRCKVYIDTFSRIQIFHNSIKLDLDGLATLRVRAFDAEENVFTSLVGLNFMWQLIPESDGLIHHLAHVPLKDSPLSDCGGLCGDLDIQIKLEDSGVFSDLFVVKGSSIGHEIVSVHLLEPLLEQMEDKIFLTVAEAMSLDPPSPVFVLIGATVRYILKVIHGNIAQVVALPSPFHQWSVLNSSVAEVDSQMGMVNALNLGVTTITVEDTRVSGHMQMSSLHVVLPDTLSLYILPLDYNGEPLVEISPIPSMSCWYVVSGRQYIIQMKVFSQGLWAQEIFLTETDDVKLLDGQFDYWDTFPVSDSIALKHGWRNSMVLKATSVGLGKLMATLTYSSGHHATKEVLKVVQEVMVCDKVKFSMDTMGSVLIPWAPGVYQEVELEATGGCAKASSDYKWFSSDTATVSVSASGILQAKTPGSATIKVVSTHDPFNYDEIKIEVSVPSSMVMLPIFPVESVVGSHLQASVTLKTSNSTSFYQCDAFSSSIKWSTGSESFTVVNATTDPLFLDKHEIAKLYASSYGSPCAWTKIYTSSSGRTMLHATLTKEYHLLDHSVGGPIVLKASSHIAAYLPLVVLQVSDGTQFGGYWFDLAQAEAHNKLQNLEYLYLAPGTHLDVMLRGGPERWDEDVDFIDTVVIINEGNAHEDGVLLRQMSTSYGSQYRIFCQSLGDFKLVFKRGNLVGHDHPVPTVADVEMFLTCSIPSSIAIIADEAINDPEIIWLTSQADRGPGRVRVAPITIANGRTIRMSAVGLSNSGRAFGNSSSLSLAWDLSNCDGSAFWDDVYTQAATRSSWERFLVLQNATGLCTIGATVTGFGDVKSSRHFTPLFELAESVLTDAVCLQLVSSLRVNPEFNLLFFSLEAKLNLSITGGSCFLDVAVNDTQIIDVIQPPQGSQCSQLVLSPKGLGTALVTVYDIGLVPPLAAASVVKVADVDWIKITSGEEISLMEGSSLSVNLLAGTEDGSIFDPSQYVYMNISVHVEDRVIELVDSSDFPSPIDGCIKTNSFVILARYLGITTLYVSCRQQSGHEILSQLIKVEVYAPPRIYPGDIFLVPGASCVLTVRGGPTIGSYIEFTSMDDETVAIHKSSGRLSAISPGNTTIVATVYTNGDITACQAYGTVRIGVPSSIILNVQSEQLAVGHEMAIYPAAPLGDLFSFYELCKDYRWSIEDKEVLSFRLARALHGDKCGILFTVPKDSRSISFVAEQDDGYKQVVYGRSAGCSDVVVSLSCDFTSRSFSQTKVYNASITLRVASDLPLALGAPITWVLPPHYTTSKVLPSSYNLYGQGDGRSRKGAITYSLLRESGGRNDNSQYDPISIEGGAIKTMESDSLACIQAKDRSSGRTEVAACIRVAEVAQIRIATQESLPHTISLPVGAELELPVNYYDVLGNPFYEAHNVIVFDAETNYPDVVSINSTRVGKSNIHLKAIRHGRALVRVSFKDNQQKADYLMISVGAHIHPQNPVLHMGTQLNFSIQGLDDQAIGNWLSTNASIISVDKLSGKAEAVGKGATQIVFEGSSLKLQTTVTVLEGSSLSVDAPKETLTNVPFPSEGFSFSVTLNDAYSNDVRAAGNNMYVLFDCKMDPSFVGYTKPWRDVDTGNAYCIFFPYSPEHLARSIPKEKDIRQPLSISISASLRGATHISGSASALFVGGFSILEMDKNSLQLNLTSNYNESLVTLVGNTDVEVHWHNKDMLIIRPVHRDLGLGRAQYEIKVLGTERFRDTVVVTLPATGQKEEVNVSYEPTVKTVLGTRDVGSLWASILGGCILLIFTVAISICYLDSRRRPEPDRSRSFVPPATASVGGPVTPEPNSPAVVNEQSPRTPQPFIEYVRRTIDETPYYRQEGRRRFNPQHTL